ncbi:MAG: hypothetical protein AAGA56_18855, partial [Myxococcota bacterium]
MRSRLPSVVTLVLFGCTAMVGCEADDGAGAVGPPRVAEPAPAVDWPHLDCDPLVPSFCAYPWPSNVYTVAAEDTVTGRRVSLRPGTIPDGDNGAITNPDKFPFGDGFSPSAALLAQLPGVSLNDDAIATPLTIERSLDANSPTVILDAETGERIAHWAELDATAPSDEERTLLLHPARPLEPGRRYIAALRGLSDRAGVAWTPSSEFLALRDQFQSTEESIEARRPLYADIFSRLAQFGLERSTLQLAWDFTTASVASTTGWMVHMRDEGLRLMDERGVQFTISDVTTGVDDRIAFRLDGSFEVPLYLDDHRPGGRLVFGPDGMPEPMGTYPVKFVAFIPSSVTEEEPGALLQYGHGLFGNHGQVGGFTDIIHDYGYTIFGVTMWGMGNDIDDEWEDVAFILDQLSAGSLDQMPSMFDRLHQGLLNHLLAMHMMREGLARDPTYGPLIDPDRRFYHGISQGGIFGGSYMALSTEVERGVLGVMGMPYNLLLSRSVDFNPFLALLNFNFRDARAKQTVLGVLQLLWDRTEPAGYTRHIEREPLPGTPSHSVLMRAAVGDHQVSELGAHIMARDVGAVHVDTGVRSVFGLESRDSLDEGSSFVEYDFGLPPSPTCNIPQSACDDPHGKLRQTDASKAQLDLFLRTGRTENTCPNQSCRFPDQSGCDADEVS